MQGFDFLSIGKILLCGVAPQKRLDVGYYARALLFAVYLALLVLFADGLDTVKENTRPACVFFLKPENHPFDGWFGRG